MNLSNTKNISKKCRSRPNVSTSFHCYYCGGKLAGRSVIHVSYPYSSQRTILGTRFLVILELILFQINSVISAFSFQELTYSFFFLAVFLQIARRCTIKLEVPQWRWRTWIWSWRLRRFLRLCFDEGRAADDAQRQK